MRKVLFAILGLFLLVSCSPTLTIKPDGTLTATNYAVVHGNDSYVPKPLISMGFADSIVKLAEGLGGKILSTGQTVAIPPEKPPEKSPVIVPPVVTLPPSPAVPIPTTSNLALFDLGPGPDPGAWMLMQQAGFPCRENVCLYALGQVARGYPIPGQSEELAAIDAYYQQIQTWYGNKVNEGRAKLTANPSLTLIICTNDAKDRFGFRLCPPTLELFADFGGRVTLGTITPESEY